MPGRSRAGGSSRRADSFRRGNDGAPMQNEAERVYELEGVLGHAIMTFVEQHVRSLLTWDILVFFYRNPDAVLDLEGLAARLGRRTEELKPEVDALCADRILQCAGGLIRYKPGGEVRETIGGFVDACQDRGRRLALIALVLHKINPSMEY